VTALRRLIDSHADVAPPSGEQRARARARLDSAIDGTPVRARRSSRRRALLVVAVAVVALGVVLEGPWRSGGASSSAVAASCDDATRPASLCLHAFAGVARAQREIARGRAYWEEEIDYGSLGMVVRKDDSPSIGIPASAITRSFFVRRTSQIRVWITRDARVYATSRGIGAIFDTPADRAAWQADGSPSLARWLAHPGATTNSAGISARKWFGLDPSQVGTLDIDHLPATAEELLRQMRLTVATQLPGTPGATACAAQLASCPIKTRGIMNRSIFTSLVWLLRYPLTTPAARGTVFDALGRLRGAALLGRVSDPRGRQGVGLLITHNPDDNVLLFQPQTGQLIATGHLSDPKAGPSGIRWGESLLVRTGSAARVPSAAKTGEQWCCG
jgi:hypothetical protein